MSARPVIGIGSAIETARWGVWEAEALVTPTSYARAIQDAGGLALVLPPDDEVAQAPDVLLDMLDALLLAGGADIDPAAYGAKPHPETRGCNPVRDRFELALCHRALECDLPVLGICRGMELLNVACGGTLQQHVERIDLHRHTPGVFCDHQVRVKEGSLAARAVGSEATPVKSHHHQAVERLGDGLEVTGWSAEDDLPEAIELRGKEFALGVLWHPEEDIRSRVVGQLVEAARTARVGAA